jgi:hypothetical protein
MSRDNYQLEIQSRDYHQTSGDLRESDIIMARDNYQLHKSRDGYPPRDGSRDNIQPGRSSTYGTSRDYTLNTLERQNRVSFK